jgi:hypothetical protein
MSAVISVVTPCSSERALRIGRKITPPPSLRVEGTSGSRQQAKIILLSLFFHTEDGSDIFLRSVGVFPNYAALQPKDHTLYTTALRIMTPAMWIKI